MLEKASVSLKFPYWKAQALRVDYFPSFQNAQEPRFCQVHAADVPQNKYMQSLLPLRTIRTVHVGMFKNV
jgi:hypothetical protein